jgi:formylglycine-generating enzyme required for sulfatase activity
MTVFSSHPLTSGYPPTWASAWGQDPYGPWGAFRLKDVEQRLRWIPSGRFLMGSPPGERGRYDEEGLQHQVQLTQGFWLFDTPCTQALWQAVMGTNPSTFKDEQRPVESVSWDDCQQFLVTFNQQFPELSLVLPTEAQWEYACRAGTQTARYEARLDAISWYSANSNNETHEVGQKRQNAWGLYDMLGNVYEWCQDGQRDYKQGAVVDPVGPTGAGSLRVLRGGSWFNPTRVVRAAHRNWVHPGHSYGNLGFRCASSGVSA